MNCRRIGIVLVVAIGAMVLVTQTARAAWITEDLYVTIVGGSLDGVTGTGTFSYDSDNLEGSLADPTKKYAFPPYLLVGLNMFEGTGYEQLFDETNDADVDYGYPELELISGVPTMLSFLVSETGVNATVINHPLVESFEISNLTVQGDGYHANATVTYQVPEPSMIALWGLCGLAGLAFWSRKRRNAA